MDLPPAEELSRWTVNHVTNWLTQCSLTAFRDDFIKDSIDGSKLMRLTGTEIDQKYKQINSKKRTALKEYVDRIESSRPPPTGSWNRPPPLPDRRRNPVPPPQQEPDDDADSEGSWGDDFDDIDQDYVEPKTTPPQFVGGTLPKPSQGMHGQQRPPAAPPDEEYEIPAEEIENIIESRKPTKGLERKGTILDRLKNELESRKFNPKTFTAPKLDDSGSDSDGSSYVEPISNPNHVGESEAPPPPRPPRRNPASLPTESAPPQTAAPGPPGGRNCTRPPARVPAPAPPDDVYEVMAEEEAPAPPDDVYEVMAEEEKSDGDEDYLEPEPPINQDLTPNNQSQKIPPHSHHILNRTCSEPTKPTPATRHRRMPESPSWDEHTFSSTMKTHKPPSGRKEPALPALHVFPVHKAPDEPPVRPIKKISTEKTPAILPPPPTSHGGWLHSNEASPVAALVQPPSPSDDLSEYPWYQGKIGREAAQRIFTREQKDGMFLIRKSERDVNQPYTLMLWYDRIWNIPIRRLPNTKYAAGKFKEGETQCSTIPELVDHFKTISLNLKSNNQVEGSHHLTDPAPKR